MRHKLINGVYAGNSKIIEDRLDTSYLDSLTMKTNKKNKFSTENEMEGYFENSSQVSLHKELFLDYSSNVRVFFSANSDNIDFRFVEYSKRSEPYLLTVVNNSCERIYVKRIYDSLNPNKKLKN